VFDGSIDHVWIAFPEPPHHTHSNSKRLRTSTTSSTHLNPTPKKLLAFTRYDWNFLSTLSPTVLGWFCVLNRIQKPVEHFLRQRENRVDAVLAYFLVETKAESTLSESRLYELFTPKTKYLLSHPVCQLVSEFRKNFNRNQQIDVNLQPHAVPDIKLLKQGIRETCRDWAGTFKRQPKFYIHLGPPPPASATTTSPIDSILPTSSNERDQATASPSRKRAASVVDRAQRLIGREPASAKQAQTDINVTIASNAAVRRRMTVQNTRSNPSNKETTIEIPTEPPPVSTRHRASSFFGKDFVTLIART
jgi:hypothetical protein